MTKSIKGIKTSLEDMKTIIVRYAEIGLKGKNRSLFERALVDNIKDFLNKKHIGYKSIKRLRGVILVYTERTGTELGKEICGLARVFGISSISLAFETKTDIDSIKKQVDTLIDQTGLNRKKTFRITAQRSNKSLPYTSSELEVKLGSYVVEKTGSKVSLKGFDVEIGVLLHENAYIFTQKVKGVGGLPIGVEGKVLSMIENEDSVLAAWFMMKRGCDIELCSYNPKRHNVSRDMSILRDYYYRKDSKIDSKGLEIKKLIENENESLKKIMGDCNCKALVMAGTLKEMKRLKKELGVLIINPLVGFSKKEVSDKMR